MANLPSSVLKEDVDPSGIKTGDLTSDCYYIHRTDGQIDLAKGSAVPIFDDYHDRKITISEIQLAGGTRNPKNSKPEI